MLSHVFFGFRSHEHFSMGRNWPGNTTNFTSEQIAETLFRVSWVLGWKELWCRRRHFSLSSRALLLLNICYKADCSSFNHKVGIPHWRGEKWRPLVERRRRNDKEWSPSGGVSPWFLSSCAHAQDGAGIDGGGRETKCLYYFILFCPTILIFIKLSDCGCLVMGWIGRWIYVKGGVWQETFLHQSGALNVSAPEKLFLLKVKILVSLIGET